MSENTPTTIAKLATLYQKSDGTMRTCRHYPDNFCTIRVCVKRGCQRAADVLREGTLA